MKKLLFVAAVGVAGLVSANSISEKQEGTTKDSILVTECNTQSTQDADGDDISVTCCRTTYEEAYNCAAGKLKQLAMAPLD